MVFTKKDGTEYKPVNTGSGRMPEPTGSTKYSRCGTDKTIYQTPEKWKSIWTISGHLYFIHSELWASDVAHSTSFPALLGVQHTASLCLFSHCHPKNANSQRLIASVSQCFLLCQSVLIMNSCVNESSILTDLPARHKQVNHLKAFPR